MSDQQLNTGALKKIQYHNLCYSIGNNNLALAFYTMGLNVFPLLKMSQNL